MQWLYVLQNVSCHANVRVEKKSGHHKRRFLSLKNDAPPVRARPRQQQRPRLRRVQHRVIFHSFLALFKVARLLQSVYIVRAKNKNGPPLSSQHITEYSRGIKLLLRALRVLCRWSAVVNPSSCAQPPLRSCARHWMRNGCWSWCRAKIMAAAAAAAPYADPNLLADEAARALEAGDLAEALRRANLGAAAVANPHKR